jgi:hypothetical protein
MLACSVACIGWSWWAGRDLNWDQLNYHFYAAYLYLDDRVSQDFMGASFQGYLNALAYVPFYLMVRANWHSLVIGSTLALIHSTCLWLTYGIARVLIPAQTAHREAVIAASVVLALLAPLYLVEIGSSFIDVTTTIPVLAGVLLVMAFHVRPARGALVFIGGALLGAACALKLTNVIFALAAGVFVLFASVPLRRIAYLLAGYAIGGAIGFLLFEGSWALRLYREFGNPFFPFFNAWFRSPEFPPFNLVHARFVAQSAGEYVLFPLRILDLYQRVYSELRAPDIRFLVVFVLLTAAAIAALLRRIQRPSSSEVATSAHSEARLFGAAAAFTLASYVLLLVTSGIGRYGIPLELYLGPMIMASFVALRASPRVTGYATAAVLVVQAAFIVVALPTRWNPTEWKSRWFDVNVPDALRDRPYLFLSLNKQTNAFLAPFMNPKSSFVNLAGQVSLALDRPGGARLRALLDRHRPNIRTLLLPAIPIRSDTPPASVIEFQNNLLKRVGLQVDPADCVRIPMYDESAQNPGVISAEPLQGGRRAGPITNYISCATVPAQDAAEPRELAERRARDDRAFAILEAMCPRNFDPAGAYTDHVNAKLGRSYFNSDSSVWELAGNVEYEGWRWDAPIPLGAVDAILDGRLRIDCRTLQAPKPIGD